MSKLSQAEKFCWDFIQDNLVKIPDLTITELSELANVSTATIVRTVQKQGYTGYASFKQSISSQAHIMEPFSHLEGAPVQIKEAILKNYWEVTHTISQLNIKELKQAAEVIRKADMVYIFARGLSELLAEEVSIKLALLGKTCKKYTDPNLIKGIAQRVRPGDAILFITLNGETKELVEAAKISKDLKGTNIVICTNKESNIMKYEDLALIGFKSKNSFLPEYEVHSRLPLSILCRILVDILAIQMNE
ncbi:MULTISPECIES: MurR/RpiR family transcriptional regulator [Aerococcus]|uniref:MurR/RpiR family transcriptional regulator n=1 Tax=Aerococcus sanguinicola TaxID=119206 RepID=A0A5N1GGQ4_9LACT|nr:MULTISPECIES: MurR/RpiR family transcriptional regulator [Aerococcus]KAA9300145.1 MurR/RpiR family transcriptional regulator [Aerococcus sanguinicola]MDK6369487.1 MurR/RpiR family transcriptional regulator [Aerococcus sp. UMB9870]MDK6679974.1 MurR/RpiR family transcriptional regulator [Aerococcus sp. UMB8608]MDK6686144.1 MurR/RpiR family transcriptional regulator [Aerococcus sp. UMB8623]MDK6939924.1 MurR/RpiR family transcriptional regulator [Aerococcus sp. UMB8487]